MDCQFIKELGNLYIPNVTYKRLDGQIVLEKMFENVDRPVCICVKTPVRFMGELIKVGLVSRVSE